MKRVFFVCLFPFLATAFLLSQSNPVPGSVRTSQADPKAQARALDSYGKLPLSFEANHGQADGRVKFLTRTNGYSLFLTGDEAVLALRGRKGSPQGLKPSVYTARNGAAEAVPFPKLARARGFQRPETGQAPSLHREQQGREQMSGGVLRMKLRNANLAAKVTGLDELAGTSNYFIGNDPAKWRTNVPTYAKVKYEGIYSGIDLVYYGNQRQLEYDFIVAPGADPRRIAFDVSGAKRIRRDEHGDLVLRMGGGEIRWHKPVVYQERKGTRQLVAARYAIADTNRVGFEVAKYDASRPLYIDPLIYSTYLGGSSGDYGAGIAVDSAGNAYVTGLTGSTDFPTKNPLQPTYSGGGDAFVAKIDPTGSALVYSTYLGGSVWDEGAGIAVDSAGNAYVAGWTTSTDFPTTPGAFQTACGDAGCFAGDAFVTKLNPTGSALVYSTYLGGTQNDYASGVAVDSAGNAYVTGTTGSTDFPTKNPLQPTNGGQNAFLAKITPTGSALVYSTYLGGSGGDNGYGIAVDSAGNAYVTGDTGSDFPTKNPLQPTYGGSGDAFVAKIDPSGSTLVYSTYLGGSGSDSGAGITADSAGNAYVTGWTVSTDFPTTPGALQTICNGGSGCSPYGDAFVAKINPTGSALVYSTYLGGRADDYGTGIAADSAGNAYVVGLTVSHNFPTKNPLQKKNAGFTDAFVSKLNPTGSALVYSTYLGGSSYDSGNGIALDSTGNAYVTGDTDSTDFPTIHALQPANAGNFDAFVAKLFIAAVTTTTLSSSPNPSTYGQAVTFTAVVTSVVGAPADGETVSFMKGKTVLGTGTLSGGSASFTTSTLKVGTTSVKAVYGGDSNFAGSTSKAVKQVVEKAGE